MPPLWIYSYLWGKVIFIIKAGKKRNPETIFALI